MKYIIMCGGKYPQWDPPKWLQIINNEPIVGRTIRLLQENGIRDIAISGTDKRLKKLGVPVLKHDNPYNNEDIEHSYWVDAFYPMDDPVCYLMGDVVFSPEAIRTIIDYKVEDVMFFASSEPAHNRGYIKDWCEPFAFKVMDTQYFRKCINITKEYQDQGIFTRAPIAWELWQVIRNTRLNHIVVNYCAINDYTCDVDSVSDLLKIAQILQDIE